ncbi:MBG domain-containing protein, partial [Enterococcus faecalis]|uniref:MBG domain-containing protein n=1 Tax=Enterococcus faecalis TaxID=1351 RepID=UPI00403F3BB7
GVGSYGVTGSGLAANSANYAFTFAQGAGNATALTINPASLVVVYGANAASRVYGAANPTLSGTLSAIGLANGDTLSGVTTGSAAWTTAA